jgi:hypothetical protein
VFQEGKTDCLAACVASLLEVDLSSIVSRPGSALEVLADYLPRLQTELEENYGLELVFWPEPSPPKGFSIKVSWVCREWSPVPCLHAMVAKNGKVVHDPAQVQSLKAGIDRRADKEAPAAYWLLFRTIDFNRFLAWMGGRSDYDKV